MMTLVTLVKIKYELSRNGHQDFVFMYVCNNFKMPFSSFNIVYSVVFFTVSFT